MNKTAENLVCPEHSRVLIGKRQCIDCRIKKLKENAPKTEPLFTEPIQEKLIKDKWKPSAYRE